MTTQQLEKTLKDIESFQWWDGNSTNLLQHDLSKDPEVWYSYIEELLRITKNNPIRASWRNLRLNEEYLLCANVTERLEAAKIAIKKELAIRKKQKKLVVLS